MWKGQGQDRTPSSTFPSLAQGAALNPDTPPFKSTSTNFCASQVNSVLLQTARACIYNMAAPHHSIEVRCGSQWAYLSEHAMKLLQLEPTGEHQHSIASFCSSQERLQGYPFVEVGMRTQEILPLVLSLYVVPTICQPLVSQLIATCAAEAPHLT